MKINQSLSIILIREPSIDCLSEFCIKSGGSSQGSDLLMLLKAKVENIEQLNQPSKKS